MESLEKLAAWQQRVDCWEVKLLQLVLYYLLLQLETVYFFDYY